MSKCSPWCLMGPICSSCVHYQIHLYYMCKIDSQLVQPFDKFPSLLNCWSHKTTQNAALWYRGANCFYFSLCPFPDESTEVYQIWCKSVQPFDSFPRLWICDPLTPPPPPPDTPPGVLRGDLYLAYTHSQMNPQMWTKVGANWSSHLTAFPGLWLFDPLKLSKCPPCVSRGNLFGVYPFPDESTKLVPIGPAVWI